VESSYHQFADDTQLFLAIKASSISADLAKLESCSQAVKGWFAVNNLMLNADKLDMMLIGTLAQLRAADHISEIAGPNLIIIQTTKLSFSAAHRTTMTYLLFVLISSLSVLIILAV